MEKNITATAKVTAIRNEAIATVADLMENKGPLRVSGTEIAYPIKMEDGSERWVVIKVSVPKGSRDGTPYDGYYEAEFYQQTISEKEAKARAAAEKRALAEAKRAGTQA